MATGPGFTRGSICGRSVREKHLHCLFGLNADMTIAKALQLMKGESAYWINNERISPVKFEWANEDYEVSVSESALEDVRVYIDTQEDHHRKTTFAEEVAEFMQGYNFLRHG